MKRSLWTQPLTKQSSPAWPCPACASGTLAFVPNSFVEKETVESKQTYKILGEPESITYTFSAWLKCSYGNCGEKVAVIGVGKVIATGALDSDEELNEGGPPSPEYQTIYQPLFCWPMLDMFELPEKCPDKIKLELQAGFRLFWLDQAASAGRLRVSLERLMDHCRVPQHLGLHKRIEKFSEKDSVAGEKLMALKWLGNTGSHQSNVSRDDLLDGFEILEFLVAELFDKRTDRVTKLARQISKKHKSRRK